jgi:hypothetical protein
LLKINIAKRGFEVVVVVAREEQLYCKEKCQSCMGKHSWDLEKAQYIPFWVGLVSTRLST